MGSMLGFLLFTEDEDLGALNLFSRKPGLFDEPSETAACLLASHAAVALSSARIHDQLVRAVDTPHVICGAMGILMAAAGSPRTRRSTSGAGPPAGPRRGHRGRR
ncbi:GAF domain-containing protein [Streptomyces cavourensis]|nr:GAF domain-containing protein [Streptomyces cavourensis]